MGVYLAIADTEVELADRVVETTQTTGTGTYSLDGVSSIGRQSFVGGVGSGNATIYTCELDSAWEIGVGTVTAGAPDTLTRDFVIASSNGGNAVSWASGVKTIFIDTVAALLLQTLGPGKVLWDNLSGGNNATVITVPLITSYYDGMTVWFRKNSPANTASMTLDVNGLGAKSLLKAAGVQIGAGEAAADSIIGAVYVASLDDFLVFSGLKPVSLTLDSLTLDGDLVYALAGGLATPQTASGTAVTFSGIRSDAHRITIMLTELSLSSTDDLELALGDSGGFETADYTSLHQQIITGTATQTTGPNDAFLIGNNTAPGGRYHGIIVLALLDSGTDLWIMNSTIVQRTANVGSQFSIGSKALSSTLTQLRLQASGANTFDIGTVNILVE